MPAGRQAGMEPNRKEATFLFPVQAMKIVYQAIFMKRLRKMIKLNKLTTDKINLSEVLNQVAEKTCNVYAKAPFKNVESVVEYLGRYTHKVALSHHRIKTVTDSHVSFNYKDYQDSHKKKVLTITKEEFLRRMELHILPKRYVKIRHYGYLQNQGKRKRIDEIKVQLKKKSLPIIKVPIELKMMERYQMDILKCKKCATGRYQLMEIWQVQQCGDGMHVNKKFDNMLLPNKAPPQYINL